MRMGTIIDDFLRFCKTGIPPRVLLLSFVLLCVFIAVGICSKRVKRKRLYVLICVFIEYVLLVVGSTVIFRFTMPFHRVELMPFWDLYAICTGVPGVHVWDIILNISLFVPLGIMLSFNQNNRWYVVMVCAILLSVTIETLQFVFFKGIAQTDDVINNTIGAILGYSLNKKIHNIAIRHEQNRK